MKEQEAILQTLIDDETQLKDLALGDLAGQ
jgi:hypothetical protein